MSIVALDDRILDRALSDLSFPDAEDAMQYYSALRYGASLLITRNTKDFRAASIPVVTWDSILTHYPDCQTITPPTRSPSEFSPNPII